VEKVIEKKAPGVVALTEEEKEIIKKVFSNLEFETGKSVIRSSSFASLDELAELLKKKTSYKLNIDGHTDNVGGKEYNQKLSYNRATAVKKYLTDKSIDSSRIFSAGYGMTRPIAPNTSPESRQKNRRVEFTIVE
ncbi:MAG: OmpA family protein, partial [Bacteroidia bacterium]|nr:OmpA family protein [Bacteroidia bacterium]